ncbi:hypothetical protein Tco_1338124 [Tanacetum coccineum]
MLSWSMTLNDVTKLYRRNLIRKTPKAVIIPLVMNGNRQMVPVDYFFNNDLKYLQGGILTMTSTTSITKTKAAQYDLLGIKDMETNDKETTMTEQNNYITATRKNFVSNDNEGRMSRRDMYHWKYKDILVMIHNVTFYGI